MSITFHAEIYKVQTLVDGGLRLTLDLPETAIAQAAQMMGWKRNGVVVEVICKTEEYHKSDAKIVEAWSKRKSGWTPAEGTSTNTQPGNGGEQDD